MVTRKQASRQQREREKELGFIEERPPRLLIVFFWGESQGCH